MRPHPGRKHEFQMIKYHNNSIQLHCLYAFQLKLFAITCCVVILEIRVSLTPVTSLHTKYIMYVCMQKKSPKANFIYYVSYFQQIPQKDQKQQLIEPTII